MREIALEASATKKMPRMRGKSSASPRISQLFLKKASKITTHSILYVFALISYFFFILIFLAQIFELGVCFVVAEAKNGFGQEIGVET